MRVLTTGGARFIGSHLTDVAQAVGEALEPEADGEAAVLPLPPGLHDSAPAGVPEFTILIPCLNEAETLAACIREARSAIAAAGIDAEILVSDNGSSDGSEQIAESEGARVVDAPTRGYGAAVIAGIEAARGTYVITYDADGSHDLGALPSFIEQLREGKDLVMGNRFRGGMEDGSMPFLHKYLGNPVLSFIGRRLFRLAIGDFHCGIRGFRRDAIRSLGLCMTGFEGASEMVVRAALANLAISEVSTIHRRDQRSRPPHLRTWRDGWRHLRFLVVFNPNAMLVLPGLAMFCVGLVASTVLVVSPSTVASAQFDINALVVACLAVLVGLQTTLLGGCALLYGRNEGLTSLRRADRWTRLLRFETCVSVGVGLCALGLAGTLIALGQWDAAGLGHLDPRGTIRLVLPSATSVAAGGIFLSCGLMSFLLMLRDTRRPTAKFKSRMWRPAGAAEVAVSSPPMSGYESKRPSADRIVWPIGGSLPVQLEPARVARPRRAYRQ